MKLKFLMLILPVLGFSQELLTVEDAVALALKNNYDIRIASNDVKIDEQNVSLANAGILPRVDANVADNNSIQTTSQVRSDGTRLSLDDARNNSLTYGVSLDWTIFDGFRMFARYDQLKELQNLGEAELQQTILTRVGDVMTTYFDIVQQQQQLKALDTAIVISDQRVTLAQNRFSIGKASKLEVLNAQVDLNTDRTNQLRQRELLANTKIRLNEIIARDVNTQFVVVDSVDVDHSLLLPDLTTLAEKQNPGLQAQIINKRVAELQLKQVRAARYPTVSVTTGYNFNESKNSLGFTAESYARGLNYGIGASMNIFNGFLQKRNERIAKLQVENSEIAIEQVDQALKSQLSTAYQSYLTNISLMDVESKNQALARQNFEITNEKFRIGTITTFELRTAQLNYINAQVRYFNALFQAKLSEISLKELAGNLTF